MAARVFVDANVLLRFYFSEPGHHRECTALLEKLKGKGVELWISGQVIREFYVQATRTQYFPDPNNIDDIIRIVEALPLFFHIVDESREARELLPSLLLKYQVRKLLTHDANHLAMMLANDIDIICTLDSNFEDFSDRVNILSPLAEDARKSEDSG
ncbi:MAG: type II toxin-antitoxin system VapC family toxin [Anaerolineaceae bacterium]|nr:type II toxin-antitoxin system VapC family toxin [Anaerolineaceae bacterium]